MRMITRHLILAFLPLALGVVVGWAFAQSQAGCGSLVGPLFAAKCGRIKAEYQLWVQTAVTAALALLTALVGAVLEWRRERRRGVVTDDGIPRPAAQ